MKFKLFKWDVVKNELNLERYVEYLEEKGWASVGSTVVMTHVNTGEPTRVIIHCVAQPKDNE